MSLADTRFIVSGRALLEFDRSLRVVFLFSGRLGVFIIAVPAGLASTVEMIVSLLPLATPFTFLGSHLGQAMYAFRRGGFLDSRVQRSFERG
jgi:hypothetical protein